MISLVDVDVALDNQPILKGLTAHFTRGAWSCIVGPNGVGKTTLLKTLAGLLTPTRGMVHVNGQPLTSLSRQQRAKQIAWLTQHDTIDPHLTVRDVVELGRLPHRRLWHGLASNDEQAIDFAMEQAGCRGWSQRCVGELSGGQRQTIALARMLAGQAPIMLFDEPATYLDPQHQVHMVRLFQKLAAAGHTVITVVHDLNLALQADWIALLGSNSGIQIGSSQDPATHDSLAATFNHAVCIAPVADSHPPRWYATFNFNGVHPSQPPANGCFPTPAFESVRQ